MPVLIPCQKCDEEADQEKIRAVQVRKELTIEQRLQAAHVPERFKDAGYDQWIADSPTMFDVKKTIVRFGKEIRDSPRGIGRSYILVGPPGTGKTMLAIALIRQVVGVHKRARYSCAGELFASIKATYNGEGNEMTVLDSFVRPDLLVLDEVGQSFGTDSERVLMFRVINARYERLKPSILITNLTAKSLVSLGEPILDRLKEGGGGILEFVGRSKRK